MNRGPGAGETPLRAAAVVVAAGAGRRMAGGASEPPKPYRTLLDRPVLAWTLGAFEACPAVDTVVLVVREGEERRAGALVEQGRFQKVARLVTGGESRQESVYRGLGALPGETRWVVVHDGVRPLVSPRLIEAVLAAAQEAGAATAAQPLRETVKRQRGGWAVETLDRSQLVTVQTPQAFRYDLLRRAHEVARSEGRSATDDAALVESLGTPTRLVEGDPTNIKLTVPGDLAVAAALLAAREGSWPGSLEVSVGVGYDIHPLVPGRPMVLGGVLLDSPVGPAGHSDADVLAHAVIDALLGGAGLGDIGRHFPDTDPRYAGARSLELLEEARSRVQRAGYQPTHVDATVILERPRLLPYVDRIRQELARALLVAPARVNVKAKTHEGLGPLGRGEGIAALASVTLLRVVQEGRAAGWAG